VRREGSVRAASIHDVKNDALQKARELALNNDLSQVKIHGKDGKILEEHTYRQDPEKYLG
jgi:F420-dependent methylenetetrahydromethanopterin dehydrogenase